MSKHSKKRKHHQPAPSQPGKDYQALYLRAFECVRSGRLDEAQRHYDGLPGAVSKPRSLQALVLNDRAALAVSAGDLEAAREGFEKALDADAQCEAARLNLALLQAD